MKIRYAFYAVALISLTALNTGQFFTEQYMRFKLRDQYIVVSFTTTPHRIAKIAGTVQTILDQNVHIDKIYLSIPIKFRRDNLEYVIPEWLLNNTKISILRTKDYGPGTKLLGVLANVKLPPNAIIVTLDDDVSYNKNVVLQLAYKAMLNPNYAIGVSGGDINYAANGEIDKNIEIGLIKKDTQENFVAVLQGYAGIAYRPRFFKNDIYEIIDYPQDCINSDDMYLSFYLARHNIKRKIVNNKYINALAIDWVNDIGTAKDALSKLDYTADKYRACLAFMQKKYPHVQF